MLRLARVVVSKAKNLALKTISDEPGLPRVLLIGDSIIAIKVMECDLRRLSSEEGYSRTELGGTP